jgi:SagB-type dehydrogenase family enzyme
LKRLVRSPDLLIAWSGGRICIRDLAQKREILASPEIVALLTVFDRPRAPEEAARSLRGFERGSVLSSIRRLERLGLLVREDEARPRRSRLAAWNHNLASAQYHVACRDTRVLVRNREIGRYMRKRVAAAPPPDRFKRYAKAPRVELSANGRRTPEAASLNRVLRARRTVRRFARAPLPLEDLAALLRGTWGKTGEMDDAFFGKVVTKTSPSAGALHPIECYVLAWNVAGLAPGIYHYDVAGDELRRLAKRGRADVRRAAVRAASGQRWVGGAAFLCAMTAVFERTLWKYQIESAYRVLWLEAGHLAQTFALLATARGLGSFGLDGLQDSFLEGQLGLDGIAEFPVYLCGAGSARRFHESFMDAGAGEAGTFRRARNQTGVAPVFRAKR